jgi:hypothetical protein
MTAALTETRPPIGATPRTAPRTGLLLAVVLAVGVLLDLAWQSPLDGWAGLAATLLVAGSLLILGGVRNASGRLLVALAVLPALFLPLRTSPWVVPLDIIAVLALLALGASLAHHGHLGDTSFTLLARRTATTGGVVLTTPPPVLTAACALRGSRPAPARSYAVVRGVALAAPLVLVLALVLASGDAVFASLFDLSVDPSSLLPHVVAIVLGSWLATGLIARAEQAGPPPAPTAPFSIGAVEGAVVLGGLIVVYALFAWARLLVALRGAGYVVETTGLTYAEYARSGFFQLLWAAGLTLVVLVGLRATVALPSARSRRGFTLLSTIAVALTLVMVSSAVVRLELYDQAFGLTMLRLACTVFAWWIAAVFVLTGLSLAGVARSRSWLPGAVVVSAVAALLVWNGLNPEALVVEHNADRAAEGAEFDVGYAAGLSDDAVPTLVAALPALADDEQAEVVTALCTQDRSTRWNRSSRAAAAARRDLCDAV